jgi:UDP-N-acetylmuramoyl-L-alanyl-D-glutamate--2,6-diaminopimelate ligase
MKLADILPADAQIEAGSASIEIAGLSTDSRAIKRGDVFVAIAGSKSDGAKFIASAVAAGAVAVVAQSGQGIVPPGGITFVRVENSRRAAAQMAARFFPRQPRVIAAVTGTSGKTSVAAFTRQIWATLGLSAASIGTIGVVSPRGETYGSLTTPDPIALHRSLDTLAGEGVTHLAIEASSHGLDQYRLDGLRIAAGAFTNITRDHLDYHPSFAAYLAAKLRLFGELLAPGAAAIIDIDHEHAEEVLQLAKTRKLAIFSVGRKQGSVIRLAESVTEGFAQLLSVEYGGRKFKLRLPLVGAFQIENALVAAGLAIATGSEAASVFPALEHLAGAKGRIELVGSARGAQIFIDYAHKPDALAKALDALRPVVTSRLVVVFGAGGDRDRGKRPLMGAVAAAKADRVIVTDDNPRTEDPAAIRAAILAAVPGAIEIGDRREAIRSAIAELRRGDVLLIAGKGHESGQIFRDRVVPFSDHEEVAAALKEQAA